MKNEILKKIKRRILWIHTKGVEGVRAELGEANLREASLIEANLREASFFRADLPHFQIVPGVGDFEAFKEKQEERQ